ncbi:MAG TPA: hypothetical protein VGX50_01585, partial [Longimicrobium sp.]|nr:hypothetical protein [Longimicrobium sp.]
MHGRALTQPVRRPLTRILPLILLALLAPATVAAQRVEVRGGNLFYHASTQAPPRQLTTSGQDRDPQL